MPSGKQIKVATEAIAKKLAAHFQDTTWVADKLGGAIVSLGTAVTIEQVHKFLNPPPPPPPPKRN